MEDDFTLEVLGDYWVTDAEWSAAEDLFYTCMQDKGLSGWIYLVGENVSVGATGSDNRKAAEGLTGEAAEKAQEKVSDEAFDCADGGVLSIGLAYAGPRANPEGVSLDDTVFRCLAQVGRDDLTEFPIEELYVMHHYEPFTGAAAECIENPSYTN